MRKFFFGIALVTGTMPHALLAQQSAPARAPRTAQQPVDDEGEDVAEVTVSTGRNLPGSAIGDTPPDQQLSPAEIRSYGVSSVGDLLVELGPQLRSGRGNGPPVVLLNGRRISGFEEIRNLPAEAILRVDILPEEVALKYGFSADQRVINFVLRPRFRAVTTELEGRVATEGGRATPAGRFDILALNRRGRVNLHVEYQESSALTEAERGITALATPFSIPGNVVGVAGGEIDPALSARVGALTTIAGVPTGTSTPTLGDFAATAGRATVTDPTPFRTLLPAGRVFNINAIYATTFGEDVSATFNARVDAVESRASFGLPGVALTVPAGNRFSPFSRAVVVDRALDGFNPLGQSSNTITGHFGANFGGNLGQWQWSIIGNFDRIDNETLTDTGVDVSEFQTRLNANDPIANPFAPFASGSFEALAANRARSTSTSYGIDALANGSLLTLPAGKVAASFKVSGNAFYFDSNSQRSGVNQAANLARGVTNGQFNIDVPVASRARGFLGVVGSLSGNFNLAYVGLSDFGTLRTLGYGFNWAPVDAVRFIGSVTEQNTAPTIQQLGNPVITTLNVRVFDFTLGQNATVTSLTGGNPALGGGNRRVQRLGLTLKPLAKTELEITASYTDTRTDNPVANFPSATAAIEAAFPDRFTRDAAGQLTAIDARPINFSQSRSTQFRYGLNFSMAIKSTLQKQIEAFRAGKGPNPFLGLIRPGQQPPQSVFGGSIFGGGGPGSGQGRPAGGAGQTGGGGQAGGAPRAPGAGAPQGQGRPGGFGGGGGGGAAQLGGRLSFAVFHNWRLTEQVRVGAAGPVLDLLSGDTVSNGPGAPRHELEIQAGYNNNGLGVRLSANWQSATRVNGSLGGAGETLNFGSIGTVNLRLFADLTQRLELLKKYPWMRGMRVVIAADNLFNQRQRVTDQTGVTPIAYQPGYIDPLGRAVRVTVRKLFF